MIYLTDITEKQAEEMHKIIGKEINEIQREFLKFYVELLTKHRSSLVRAYVAIYGDKLDEALSKHKEFGEGYLNLKEILSVMEIV